jgi:pimeloyl-ACP methyl ester carboxylesterase
VVNPILDKFTAHATDAVNYALYIHKDSASEEVQGLPLYVYTHGFSRGGTQAEIDQKASMKSANGSVALMKRMEQDPVKYASHILNISYSGGNAPQVSAIKAIIDELVASGLVDPNRIYVAGFSMGGGVTTNLINTYPGFFAAAAPMGIAAGWPTAEENKDMGFWIFVNQYDTRVGAANLDNFVNDIKNLTNARASRFPSNEALTWPYNQYDQPDQRPDPTKNPPLLDYIAHEVEAAVLYNQITMYNPHTEETWSIAPIFQSPNLPEWNHDYTDVFDWMFLQSKLGELPKAPRDLTATAGDGRVTLKWTTPANASVTAIKGYKVWYGEETPVTVDASTNEYTFTGLTNGQEYTFKVVAFNESGESVPVNVKATPRSTYTPPYTPPSSGGTAPGGTDTDTDATSPEPSYTVNTPEDQPAVTDEDGNTTLPGGGEIVTEDGITLHVPAGTTIDKNGKVTVGSGGATVSLDNGFSFNIREGSEIVIDEDSALGFNIVSSHPFRDVNDNSWYSDYVNTAYTFDLFNGTSSTTFSPGISMTRSMFVQVLANLENIDASDYTNSSFSDVADGQWYTAAVAWAADNGIVNGISADLFAPDAPVTREQMLVILYNYMKYKGYTIPQGQAPAFADESKISPWALEAVKALQGIGIVNGKGNNIFDPQGIASRSEVAAVFVRLIEYLAKQ